MVQQALAAGMPWGDKSLNEYVNRLGQNLARSSGSQQVFAFYVLYNPEVNAQSFPGGYIVINSGAISLAESEAELASVLSHEIAHENSCDWRTAPWKGNLFELICPGSNRGFGRAGGDRPGCGKRLGGDGGARPLQPVRGAAGRPPGGSVPGSRRLRPARGGAILPAASGGRGTQRWGTWRLAGHAPALRRSAKESWRKSFPIFPRRSLRPHDEAEFLRMRQAVRDYDEIYSRVVGVRVPGHDAPPPELSRRPASPASP